MIMSVCSHTMLLLAAMVCQGHSAAQVPTEDSFWYYEIGGAEPCPRARQPRR